MNDDAWLSLHLHFDGRMYQEPADTIICDLLAPLVSKWRTSGRIQRAFFVRYSDGGPHLRFRVLPCDRGGAPALQAEMSAWLRGDCATMPRSDAATSMPLAAHLVTDVREVPYEPEQERYGGPSLLPVAEAFFSASTDTAFSLLNETRGAGEGARLGKALLAMVVLIHTFAPDRSAAATLSRSYCDGYLTALSRKEPKPGAFRAAFASGFDRQQRRVSDAVEFCWASLTDDDPLSEPLDDYRHRLAVLREEFLAVVDAGLARRSGSGALGRRDAIEAVVPSLLHMMNNRMGVPIPEEIYLAFLIATVLEGTPADATVEQST
jgi:thiopeptide-type bacteriocin biosynthesis protein